MTTIGVVTVARSDYGLYRPILKRISACSSLKLWIYVAGNHLLSQYGATISEIVSDGFPIHEKLNCLLASDSAEGTAKSMGMSIMAFAQSFAREIPDLLLVLGDRTEMLAAVIAALPFNLPVAHIHGGEITEGAIDDAIRHAITKLSHLHFVSTEEYGRRVIQMGEEPWRVCVCGAPGLDNLRTVSRLTPEELVQWIGLPLEPAPLLVTYHPVTREASATAQHMENLLTALAQINKPVIFTYPNVDTNHQEIIDSIEGYVHEHDNAVAVKHLGTQAYFSLMAHAAAMVGNSSSGIIEAASFQLPVVNIGNRQKGRLRAANVLDVDCDVTAIKAAVEVATSQDFRRSLLELSNPYGDGQAAQRILEVLTHLPERKALISKPFFNLGDVLSRVDGGLSGLSAAAAGR